MGSISPSPTDMKHAVAPKDFTTLLPQLTLPEKVSLLSGDSFSTTPGIPRLSIPPLRLADSVNGIRPTGLSSSLTTASFPNTACYGCTWDSSLLTGLGGELARQARMKSAQVVLGPTINIHRDPRAGRNFECMSEDPLLSGQLAGAVVKGVQAGGVGACPKHFVCNDSETLRHFYDVRAENGLNGRALREIYMAAWQHLLRTADPEGIMTAYNKVEGVFCSEHDDLINVLREEWGFKGLVMSDWFALHSTVESVKAGLDLEMPFPVFRGGRLVEAVKKGEITEEEVDQRVLKMLEARNRTRASHGDAPEKSEIDEQTNRIAWEIATGGMVLLKNDNGALPLRPGATRVALVGELAEHPVFTGGGSASCLPQYRQSPLEVLQKTFPDLQYAPGVRTRRIIPAAPSEILTAQDGRHGVDVAYFNNGDSMPFLTEFEEKATSWMLGEFKPGMRCPGGRLQMTTRLTPSATGKHTLAVRCTGAFTLEVDGKRVLEGPSVTIATEQFIFNHILLETRVQISLTAGQSYDIRLTMDGPKEMIKGEPTPYAATLCFEEEYNEITAIEDAATLANTADVTVIYAGRTDQYESEGFDLEDIRMPANQTALIKRVAAASAKTVLVLHAGNPIDVSAFIGDVDAVLLAHFPGQEGARAVSDILAGKVSPSGRLATTWFETLEDGPSFGSFPAKRLEDGSVPLHYEEGLRVGYRCPDANVRFPFGHGLSYTTFAYSNLRVEVEGGIKVAVEVVNTGAVKGKEVVQVYITPPKETQVWRPERELKAFTKVELTPGETTVVELDMDLKMACSYWDEKALKWRVEAGVYGVQVGGKVGSFEIVREESWNHL